jgi:hypothetical protein
LALLKEGKKNKMSTLYKALPGRERLIRMATILALSAALACPASSNDVSQVTRPQMSSNYMAGSYLVSISLDAVPGVAYPGLVSYDPQGYVVANEAVDFTGTPLAGSTITEDHGTWKWLGGVRFLVTFVKLASINGKCVYTVTTRAIVQTDGSSFQGRFNLDVRDVNNQSVIPGGLNGSITGTLIAAEPLP